jgi:hypothetical protein
LVSATTSATEAAFAVVVHPAAATKLCGINPCHEMKSQVDKEKKKKKARGQKIMLKGRQSATDQDI